MQIYKCNHFEIHELVPPAVYRDRKEAAWELLDQYALITLDRLREKHGKATVNNWYWNGSRLWSGLRTPNSPYYRPYSQHTFGRAFDMIFNDVSAQDVRDDMEENPNDMTYRYITSIELEVTWFHFDVRNCDTLKTYRP